VDAGDGATAAVAVPEIVSAAGDDARQVARRDGRYDLTRSSLGS
jgi:hypothetical protein